MSEHNVLGIGGRCSVSAAGLYGDDRASPSIGRHLCFASNVHSFIEHCYSLLFFVCSMGVAAGLLAAEQRPIEVLALVGDGESQRAIPAQLATLESLAPIRFQIVGNGDMTFGVMHVIDGDSLFSQGANGSWDRAKEQVALAFRDAVRAKDYDAVWVFGAPSTNHSVAAELKTVSQEGKSVVGWNVSPNFLECLKTNLTQSAELLPNGSEQDKAWEYYAMTVLLAGKSAPPNPGPSPAPLPVGGLSIQTTPEMPTVGAEVEITVQAAAPGEHLVLEINDRNERVLERFEFKKFSAPEPAQVKWRVPDLGLQGAYFRLKATLFQGVPPAAMIARSLYVSRKFNMKETLQYATWLKIAPSSDLVMGMIKRLFDHAGIDAITPCVQVEAEKFGWLLQPEAGNGGIDLQFGWPKESFEEIPLVHGERFPHATRSSCTLVSWGEEPGFGPCFGASYHWDEGKAPKGAKKWFHKYLKLKYEDKIEALNSIWQSKYTSLDEVPFLKANAEGADRESLDAILITAQMADDFKMLYKGGAPIVLNPDIDQVLPHLGKYLDTAGFFDWHFNGVITALIADAEKKCPWTTHYLSLPNRFSPPTPVPGGYNHPFYMKERVLDQLLVHQRQGDDNPMARLDWYFVDDPSLQANMLHQQLAMGTGSFNAWYDFPLQFNSDLTHTQGGMRMNRTLALLKENVAGPYLQNTRETNGPVGLFGVGQELFGIKFPRATFILPCVLQTGQMPRYILSSGLEDPNLNHPSPPTGGGRQGDFSLKVLIVGQQTMSLETIQKLRAFVERGGFLVILPGTAAWDDHGKPVGMYMHPELVRLSGVCPQYGLRKEKAVSWNSNAPVRPDLSPAEGDLLEITPLRCRHERCQVVEKDVQICGVYEGGTPALTFRRVGQGGVLHFNFEAGESGGEWNHGSTAKRYVLTRLLNAILAKAGLAEARPRFVHGRSGDGPQQLLWQRKHNDTRDVTYLTSYVDSRAGKLNARLLIPRDARVRDLISGRDLPVQADGSADTPFGGGEFRFFAVRSQDPAKLLVKISEAEPRRLSVQAALLGADGKSWEGQRPVRLRFVNPSRVEDGSLRRWISVSSTTNMIHYVAINDVPGKWTAEAYEPVSGLRQAAEFAVKPAAVAQGPPNRTPALFGSSPDETLNLLRRLRTIYEKGGNRTTLSYYLHLRGNDSRHAVVRRLERLDWRQAKSAWLQALKDNEIFFLTGEDLGCYPGANFPTTALFKNHALETLQQLADQADRIAVPSSWTDSVVCLFGRGRLILHRLSLDEVYPPGQDPGFPVKTASGMGDWAGKWSAAMKTDDALREARTLKNIDLAKWLAEATTAGP
ncbi:MAG: hypothetical protein HY360_02165 [Verrucomicrobia bacterium]|nr:hypothetical protein [Verrucomicrobiota bacterium]